MAEKPKIPRRSLSITPAYDPEAKRWFADEFPGVEAPSLRELLKKLPAGTKITNYYPTSTYRHKFDKTNETRPSSIKFFGYKSGPRIG